MSRGQQTGIYNTGTKEAGTLNPLANTSFTTAQQDINKAGEGINDYSGALAGFKAANPYVTGGEAQTAENQQLADVAAGQAESGGEALQGLATRTGQNAGGAIAATEHMKQQAARDLMGQQAGATERRLAAGTGYGEAVLGGEATKEGMKSNLARQQADLGTAEGDVAAKNLQIAGNAAETPSFFDTLGTSFGKSFGTFLGDPSNLQKVFKGGGGQSNG